MEILRPSTYAKDLKKGEGDVYIASNREKDMHQTIREGPTAYPNYTKTRRRRTMEN